MQKKDISGNKRMDKGKIPDVPFASHDVRLSSREWLVTLVIFGTLMCLAPVGWKKIKPLNRTPDYRIPYSLGYDYWHYKRLCHTAAADKTALVIGDSVVWGHYVHAGETLTHYLNERAGAHRFSNLGVDGTHPAALLGLVKYYGHAISDRDVVLYFNLLWLSSPQHDLQADSETPFNHPHLVPQFYPRIRCYQEPLADRLGIAIDREIALFGWAQHLRTAYWNGDDIPAWTIKNPYADPLRVLKRPLPSADALPVPKPDVRPWTAKGIQPFSPPWVKLETSFQWQCFQQTVELLQRRGNRVLVLFGPFNEHMLTDEGLQAYTKLRHGVTSWLDSKGVACCVPAVLPSEVYADASHPLAEGYALLARQVYPIAASFTDDM